MGDQTSGVGLGIDTVAMTIAAPAEKLADMHEMLLQWPPERVSASEKEVRSLVGKLLHLCTVVRIGRFSLGACYSQPDRVEQVCKGVWHETDHFGARVPRRFGILASSYFRRARLGWWDARRTADLEFSPNPHVYVMV